MNPVEEYLQCLEGEKTAAVTPPKTWLEGLSRGFRNLGTPEGAQHLGREIGGHLMYGLGGAAVGVAAEKAYRAATKSRDYEKMMAHNPDLKEYRRENPNLFNQHYTSLRGMAPEFASDPIVGGTYMRQMSTDPQSAGKVVVEALGARKGFASHPTQLPPVMGKLQAPSSKDQPDKKRAPRK